MASQVASFNGEVCAALRDRAPGAALLLPTAPEPAHPRPCDAEDESAGVATAAGGATVGADGAEGGEGKKAGERVVEMGGYPCDSRVVVMTKNISFDFGHLQVYLTESVCNVLSQKSISAQIR